MKEYAWLGLFGAAGATCRWLVGEWTLQAAPGAAFPWATLLCNMLGCFLIGFLAAGSPGVWRTRWMTGFAGAFTTFSAFSLESYLLLEAGRTTAWLLYGAVSFAGGMLLYVWGESVRGSVRKGGPRASV